MIYNKFSNYLVKELPHPFSTKEEFEKANMTTIGSEWNTLSVYKKLIQPSIIKKIGQVIEPMSLNDHTKSQKISEIVHKLTEKKIRTKKKI